MNRQPDRAAELRFDELLVRYLDGALDEPGWLELQAALAARPELRKRFNDFCLQTLAISERFAAEQVSRAATVREQPPRRWPRFARFAVAAGILVAAGLALLQWRPLAGDANGAAVARLEDSAGTVYVAEAGSEERPVAANQPLAGGQVVSTVGINSSAEIRCADGTRLILGGNTSVTLPGEGTERIRLRQGDLAADVGTRPENRPLRIFTPEAEVEARDTKLSLTSSGQQTLVGVPQTGEAGQGKVQLKRLSDGHSVPLRRGEWAVAYAQSDLRPQLLPSLPDTRSFVFGARLPPGWRCGQLVFDDLPDGSKAAVRAAPYPHRHGTWYKVNTQNEWTNGMFAIHDDSWLHVRFRVDKPGFFHTLVVARDPDPTRRLCVVLENKDFWQNRQPGRWYTVHVPFAEFEPTQPGVSTDKPLVAFGVLFDSQKVDRGLTIDRFWITRDPNLPRKVSNDE